MYTIDDLNRFMDYIQDKEKEIRIDRGLRYGGKEDTLENVATFGSDGAIISFWECAMRIKNMFGRDKDIDDLSNAVMDARNFLAYILCLETRFLGQGEYNIPPSTPQVPRKPQVVPWEDTK